MSRPLVIFTLAATLARIAAREPVLAQEQVPTGSNITENAAAAHKKKTLTFPIARSRFWITNVAFTQDGKHIVLRSGTDSLAFASDAEANSPLVKSE